MKLGLAETFKILPVLAPADIAASATSTQYIRLRDANWVEWLVQFGAMTSDSTDVAVITIDLSNVGTSTDSEANIAFSYRVSAAVATDTMGAITAATSSGTTSPGATDDNKVVVIDLDPAAAYAALSTAAYARLTITPNAQMASCFVGAIALIQDRYPGNSIPSST